MNKFIVLPLVVLLSACAHFGSSKNHQDSNSDEVSLKADRSEFDDLRKDEPPQVRKENDELAGLLQILRSPEGEYQAPERIREKFDKIMRDKRERMDRQIHDQRQKFDDSEKDKREEFTEKQKKERDDFLSDKPSSEKRDRFFDRQQEKRSRFYDDSRDRRSEFEENIHDRRKDFEDYLREKTNLFNQEYRNYQKEYDEYMKGQDLKKEMQRKNTSRLSVPQPNLSGSTDQNVPNDLDQLTEEFKEIPKGNSKTLESGK